MIPSINLGTDSLGIGQAYSSLFSATGTELCGSKPTCLAITKTCKEKNRIYNECRMRSLELMETQSNNQAAASMGANNTRTAVAENQSKLLMYAGIALAVIILLFIIYKIRS